MQREFFSDQCHTVTPDLSLARLPPQSPQNKILLNSFFSRLTAVTENPVS
jgi:hypothetical protein